MHYYFANKVELIIYCVRYYKAQCVTRYDAIVDESTSADGLATAFADKLVETLRDEAPMHRLWYDLRTQSMFEPDLREAVLEIEGTLERMIWRVVSRYAELAGAEPAYDAGTTYAVLDGIFEKALLAHIVGTADALPALRTARARPDAHAAPLTVPRRGAQAVGASRDCRAAAVGGRS